MIRKNRVLALILAFFFGFLGLDRFYLGKTTTGILKLLTFGGFGIWWCIDATLLLLDAFLYSLGKDRGFVKDKHGQDLKYGLSAYRFKKGSLRQDWFAVDFKTADIASAASHEEERTQAVPKKWLARNWKWVVPSTFACLAAAVFISVISIIKNNPVYKDAMEVVKDDVRVTHLLGTDIADTFFVTGQVNDITVSMKIPIRGSKGKGELYVRAINVISYWRYQVLTLRTDHEEIDLLEKDNHSQR